MNRQKQILLILLVVLLLAAFYAYWSSPQQATVEPGGAVERQSRRNAMNAGPQRAVDQQRVNLGLLELSKKKYTGYKRDIFNYYVPKPIAKPRPEVQPKPIAKPVVPPKPAPTITPQVRKQLAKFTFLGFLVKNTERTVFLSKRDELFLVKKADYFGEDNQFEVVDINDETLTIKQGGANGLIEIKLVEEEPLIPSFSPGEVSKENQMGSTVGRPQTTAPPANGVPTDERNRQWFKKTQPSSTE